MPRFVQPFRPNTDIGNSVQNLMTALFYKDGGNERSASQAALDRAQAERAMAEAALDRQTYGGRAGLGDALDAAMTRYSGARTRPMSLDYAQGPEAGLDLDPDTLTRMIRNEPEVYAMGQRPAPALNIATRTYDAPDFADDMSDFGLPPAQPRQQGLRIRDEAPQFPDVRQSYGAPSISSPEDERRLAAEFVAAANLASTSSNPDQIAQALGHFLKQAQERQFLEGGIDPTTWFQLDRKPVRGVQDKYDVDLTGERAPSPLGTALAAMDKDAASAEELRSRLPLNAARVDTESARQYNLRRAKSGGMSISFDENGNPVVQMGGDPSPTPDFPPPESAVSEDVVGSKGTGGSGFFGDIVNKATDAIGLGIWFDGVDKAKNALDNIGVQTITLLQVAVPGRESNQKMNELKKLAVSPGSLFQGDARSRNRLQQTRDMLATEVARMERDVLGNANMFSKQEISKTMVNHGQLKQLLREYDTLLGSFDRKFGGKPKRGGARPGAASLPAAGAARLKEGVATKFANGQVWTLRDGKAERLE